MSLFFPKEHKAKLDYKTAIKVVITNFQRTAFGSDCCICPVVFIVVNRVLKPVSNVLSSNKVE
ncbi:hypothetical protein JHK86_035990 [Glycine max]|nr:hypothetical protein JHK86_035990 [Glycine max]